MTQQKLELGMLPNKDIARFDPQSSRILQSIGIDDGRLPEPYVVILDNDSYDILLLLSDGVSDCLSDEDIIAVCKNTDRSELAKRIVEKALRHDSILPDESSTYDIGASNNRWLNIYGLNIYAADGNFTNLKIKGKEVSDYLPTTIGLTS